MSTSNTEDQQQQPLALTDEQMRRFFCLYFGGYTDPEALTDEEMIWELERSDLVLRLRH